MSNTALVQTSPAAIQQKFPEDKYNTLLPTVAVPTVPDCFQLTVSIVKIDTKDKAAVYSLPGGLHGLSKTSLMSLSNAAGVRWKPGSIRRMDDRKQRDYCEVQATATVTDLDGTVRTATASKTVDLRADAGDGKPGKDAEASKSQKQLDEARKFIDGICESKAQLRAISAILGIRRSYTAQELAKPFVVPRLALNAADPEAKQVMLATASDSLEVLFGARQLAPQPEEQPPQPVRVEVTNDTDIPDYPEIDAPTTTVKALPATISEQDESAEVVRRVTAAWKRSQKINKAKEFWEELVSGCCAPPKAADMTLVDVARIEAAVNMLYTQAPVTPEEGAP